MIKKQNYFNSLWKICVYTLRWFYKKWRGSGQNYVNWKGEREGLNAVWCPKKRSYSVTNAFLKILQLHFFWQLYSAIFYYRWPIPSVHPMYSYVTTFAGSYYIYLSKYPSYPCGNTYPGVYSINLSMYHKYPYGITYQDSDFLFLFLFPR